MIVVIIRKALYGGPLEEYLLLKKNVNTISIGDASW